MKERYSTVAIALHWAIALLIILQIVGGFYLENFSQEVRKAALPGDPRRAEIVEMYQVHKSFGITILVLSLGRLFWRLGHKPPPLPAAMPAWEKFAARAVHVAFYALMIGAPLGGWAIVSTQSFNVPTVIFGLFELPHLSFLQEMENKKEAHELFEQMHKLAAFTIVGLLGLHVAAALKHHFFNRDGVLSSMAPIFRRKSA